MRRTAEEFDYVVVGAGSAGCVLANRLSADPGLRVLLLEAGGRDLDPLIHVPIGFGIMRERRMHDWRYDSEPEKGLGGRRLAVYRGKVLGGSSSINVQVYTRGDRGDYARWERLGAEGWGYDDVLPYFKRCEAWVGGESAQRGADGPLAVQWSQSPDDIFDAWSRAAQARGHRVDYDMNAGSVAGFGRVQFNIRDGRRASSAAAYLRPAAGRPNLVVRTGALAHRIVVENGRAVGIEYRWRGAARRACASREVALCAGAFNTPQLLMLSGIGPASHLESLGIRPLADLPVGRNLQDHWSVANFYARREPGYFHGRMRADRMAVAMTRAYLFGTGPATRVPTNLLGFVRTDPALDVPDLEFLLMPTAPAARLWLPGVRAPYDDAFGIMPALMHAESRGEVLLRSTDPADPPRIRFDALREPEDARKLVLGLRMARDLASDPALAPFRGDELMPGAQARTDAELDAFVRSAAKPVYHPAGTCAMGRGEHAVADPMLRVRGIAGLRVVDASAMPDLVTGHINACVMMMAEKGADLMLGRSDAAAARGAPPRRAADRVAAS